MKLGILLIIVFELLNAQHLEDSPLDGSEYFGFHLIVSDFYNSSPNITYEPDQHRGSFFAFGINWEAYDFTNGDRFLARFKLIPDLIESADRLFASSKSGNLNDISVVGGTTLSGLFWMNYGLGRLLNGERYQLGWGYHISDYIYVTEYRAGVNQFIEGNPIRTEPAGWWFTAGPMIFADFAINSDFSLHFLSNYGFSFFRAVIADDQKTIDGYASPHFAFANLTLNYKEDFYFILDFAKAIDRGEQKDNGYRIDFALGYRIF